jgi:hypothetical protein
VYVRNGVTMSEVKVARLKEEIDSIRFADTLYRKRAEHSRDATEEYQRRQDRLLGIRSELALLKIPSPAA